MLVLALAVLCSTAAIGSFVTIAVSPTIHSSAVTLDPALISLSIEQDRWTDWAGIAEPNQFLHGALANLAERTGVTPAFRIGADSEDRTDFSFDVEVSPSSSSIIAFSRIAHESP